MEVICANKYGAYKTRKIIENEIAETAYLYQSGETTVFDIHGNKTKYFHRLGAYEKIQIFDKDGNIYSQFEYNWEGILLQKKTCIYQDLGPAYEEHYVYDKDRQLIRYSKNNHDPIQLLEYAYNKNHLCIKESHGGQEPSYRYKKRHGAQEIEYEYVTGTDLIACKTMGQIKELYFYDEDGLLVQKQIVARDIVKTESYLRDPETKMIIEKNDGLQTTYYEYDNSLQLVREYTDYASTSFEYDKAGRLLSKCFPLGGKNEYSYDLYGNLIRVKEVGSAEKILSYNKQNLPITCTINGRTSHSVYDKKNRLIEEINFKGAKTSYEYNEFDLLIKKTLPEVMVEEEMVRPEITYEYDFFFHLSKETSPSGNIVDTYKYSMEGLIEYKTSTGPDFAQYSYDTRKNLTWCGGKKGVNFYKYDEQNRLVEQSTSCTVEKWFYSGLLLASHIDTRGYQTKYIYDEHGRKIEEYSLGRTKTFAYDEMGNLCTVTDGDIVCQEVFDIEGRVIETSKDGFNHTFYEYNEEGQKARAIKLTSKGEAIDQFFYDEEGHLCKHISPTGEESLYIYDDWTRTEIDPLGNRKVQTFDALDRIIQEEKLTPSGEVLYKQKTFYDIDGNVTKKITNEHVVEYQYNKKGQMILQLESGKKQWTYEYNDLGYLSKETKPNGISFEYEYDENLRKISMKSSDGTIDYAYVYNDHDLIEIKDLVAGKSIERTYSKRGELIEEISFEGFYTGWRYDNYGRKIQTTLCDQSYIEYEYSQSCLTRIGRFYADNIPMYYHTYTKFDENQHIVEEELPMGLGKIVSSRDILELPESLCSPYHQLGLEFNKNHLVTKLRNSLTGNKEFDYDPLSQLTKENDKEYAFDALGNSKEFLVDESNQIVDDHFTYDKNGNLTRKNGTKYSYDALDRLIGIEKENGKKIHFTYDPLSRLVKKTEDQEEIFYLFDGDTEIGSAKENGEVLELKVLGLGLQGDIGAAVAIELKYQVFVPLHDFQGNIIALVHRNGKVVEKYPMSAFGEEEETHFLNPWRFSSKREVCSLVYFGMRFYDPALKRWLTPDPAGFADSQNLYQFNHASPVNRLDQFGLLSKAGNRIRSYSSFDSDIVSDARRDTMISSDYAIFGPKFIEDIVNDHPNDPKYIVECIAKLMEGANNQLAFITYQNGINNTHDHFIEMGEFLHRVFPERIIIGVYNNTNSFAVPLYENARQLFPNGPQTLVSICDTLASTPKMENIITAYNIAAKALNGIGSTLPDMMRVGLERHNYYSNSTHRTAYLFATIIDALQNYAPHAKWLHIAHSEAALILRLAYNLLKDSHKLACEKMCHVEAIGGAALISNKLFASAVNNYSTWDFVTSWFITPDIENGGFDNIGAFKINFLQSKTTSYGILHDHSFQGPTYSHYVENELVENCCKNYGGFYACPSR